MRHRFIVYSQEVGKVETTARIATLGIAHPRQIHIVFLFDAGIPIQEIAARWDNTIRLQDVEHLIRELGHTFEYARNKVFFFVPRSKEPFVY
jgi:hypothetical protein